ncbi:MAG: nucleotidyltransferase domain-containing protein [Endomicrobia bacterium]|nr:nucleotidyltransferase domain-containing protein [Endomicrobiia bacterium]
MNKKIDNLAKELRNALQKSFKDFEGLYVFGSQAKGTANEYSDVDIVVIFKNNHENESDEYYRIISKLMYDYGVVLDVHRRTRKQLEFNYLFHNEVVNRGVFYDAA